MQVFSFFLFRRTAERFRLNRNIVQDDTPIEHACHKQGYDLSHINWKLQVSHFWQAIRQEGMK